MNADTLSLSVAEALLRTQKLRSKHPGPGETSGCHPTIAVSREAGAYGETMAREVGLRLGCPVYGRELVEKIAEELRQPPERLRALDERPTSWLEEWLTGLPGTSTQISMDTYVRFLFATVRGMAEMGRCVVIGRGAPHMLPAERTLRVRVIADHADRVRRIEQMRHLSPSEAARWIQTTDDERASFIRRNFNADPADPHHYDLLLNSSRLSVTDCASLVAEAFARLQARVAQSGLS